MIEEAYVSFETAKLLKEKGFNEPCFSYYLTTKTLHTSFHNRVHVEDEPHFNCLNIENAYDIKDKSLFEDICSAPTLQMAMKWLRKVHNILLFILPAQENGKLVYLVEVWTWNEEEGIYESTYAPMPRKEPEQAVEAALKYTLENLI